MKTAQLADPDLVVPAGERARYEESFARFADVFPDGFYVRNAASSSRTIQRMPDVC